MIQTQSQNEELRQFVEARYKAGDKVGNEVWGWFWREVGLKVWCEVRKKVCRKLFR
jgi:hypothetical protein